MTILASGNFHFRRFFSVALASIALILPPTALAQTIDLAEGKLNGQPLCEMTIDDVADALGRPSAVDPEQNIGFGIELGPRIHYHHLGLQLWFLPSSEPSEDLMIGRVYFSRTWDPDHSEHYQPSPLDFASGAHLNWRSNDTVDAFSAYGPRERTPEMLKQEHEDSSRDGFMHIVDFYVEDRSVTFFHEPATRYLEYANIACDIELPASE